MARPIKNNADYFSHDADMRDDPKIKALRRRFKMEGYGIYCMLLELITDSDNFKLVLDYEIIAGDFDVEPDNLRYIIQYCLILGLFQTNDDSTILTCKTLENRFEGLLSKRKRDRIGVIVSEKPQSKVKESKEENSKAYVPPEVFGTNKEAHTFLTTNHQDLTAAKKVLTNLGWPSIRDNDVSALAYHFVEKNLDILSKPRDEVRKHFQNWLNKVPLQDLMKLSVKIIANEERKQRQSTEVR